MILLKSLYSFLNPCQIFDLSSGSPRDLFIIFQNVLHQCRIVVCGGDGTAGWILSELDKFITEFDLDNKEGWSAPPVSILPLGTGNDLARVLNWGKGWRNEPVDEILENVLDAKVVLLDRWKLSIAAPPPQTDQVQSVQQIAFIQKAKILSKSIISNKVSKELIMNNYLSIGLDASIALDFHQSREKTPHLFKSRTLNKGWYALFGGRRMIHNLLSRLGLASTDQFVSEEALELSANASNATGSSISSSPPSHSPLLGSFVLIDNERFEVGDSGGLIAMNIPSYAGGSNLLAIAESCGASPVSMHDKKLNVVKVHSSFELAASIVNLTSPTVLGTSHQIEIHIAAPEIDIQVDGEPWIQKGPCIITLSLFKQSKMLKNTE